VTEATQPNGNRVNKRSIAFFLVVVLGYAATLCVNAVLSPTSDHFQFLEGRRPFVTGVFPIMQDGARSVGFTDEYRCYSWHQGFGHVCELANAELIGLGFSPGPSAHGTQYREWTRADGYGVLIEAKKSNSRHDAFGSGQHTYDADWVTVTIQDPIPDTWASHVRYALEPNDR